jgi:dihydropteroate synthase
MKSLSGALRVSTGGFRRGAPFARMLDSWRASGDGGTAVVMGVLNATPDSFSDGNLFEDHAAAVLHGHALIAAGAGIVDIGGESTRPGATPVSAEDEIARIVPVIEGLSGAEALLSVDTVKASVAEAALAAGAHIVNDVTGLRSDPDMAQIVADVGAGLVIMHNPGFLGSSSGTEGDPVAACMDFFAAQLDLARGAGILADRIVLDPGFGFGKDLEQSLELLARLPELAALGYPLLVGTSRKSFIGRLLGRETHERLAGTLATHVAAALAGAAIVRAHDVAEHVDAMRMIGAIRAHRSPGRSRA